MDVQHKKRGRPRLREEDNLPEAAFGTGYAQVDDFSSRGGIITVPQPGRPRSKSYRELRSQPGLTSNHDQRPKTSGPGYGHGQYIQGHQTSRAPLYLSDSVPTVLLTPELIVAQHNAAFAQALALTFNARTQSFLDLVLPSEREKIHRLQNMLRAELLDAARLPPIHGRYDSWASMPAIENLDVGRATAGFHTRSEYLTFRLPNDQSRGFPISISLAEAGIHFIVLTLIQRPDTSRGVLSPTLTEGLRNQQLSSPPTQATRAPLLDRHPPKNVQPNGTHVRSYSYNEHVPLMSPTFSHGQSLELQPSHSLSVGQYSQRSPPKDAALPYIVGRLSSSPEHLRNERGRNDEASSIPAHLQLPPIRTSGSGMHESKKDDHRNGRSSSKASPVKGSPQSGRKKKRRRVDIDEMLR